MAELTPFSIRNFMKGLNRRADQQDIGHEVFIDIRNFHQDEWGKLVSMAGSVTSEGHDPIVGEILAMAVFYPSAASLAPHLIVMTDGDSPILSSAIGDYGAEGRIYRADLALTTFTEVAIGVSFSSDDVFPCRNRLVTMQQIDNKLYIATGYGPVRIWNGTSFITEAGIDAPQSAPIAIAVNGPSDTTPGASFTVNSTFFTASVPRHFAVIKGHENELYCATPGINMTEFVKYDRATGQRFSLGALPEQVSILGYALVGHNDGTPTGGTLTYISLHSGGFHIWRYTRTGQNTGTWSGSHVYRGFSAVTEFQEYHLQGAVIPPNANNQIVMFLANYNAAVSKPLTAYGMYIERVVLTPDYASLPSNPVFSTGINVVNKALMIAPDRSTDAKIYFLYNIVGEVRLQSYDYLTNTISGVLKTISGYQLIEKDSLVYVNGSLESRIRLIKGGGVSTLATSMYLDIDDPVAAWTTQGGTYSSKMVAPCISPGGQFSGAGGGQIDFAVYGDQEDSRLVKNFFQMQTSPQAVNDNIRRKYKYAYSYGNPSTTSGLSPESAEIEVVLGRPIKVSFAKSAQTEVTHSVLYRTDGYSGVGSAPPVRKALKTDRNNVAGKRWQVNDKESEWFIDDSDIAMTVSNRPTQPEMEVAEQLLELVGLLDPDEDEDDDDELRELLEEEREEHP